jgi:hypothetical protein
MDVGKGVPAVELNDEFDGLAVDIDRSPSSTPVLDRKAIVVAGPHRSGTSALARVLSLVGCDLPKHVMPPLDYNELGLWEPMAVAQAHEAFLTNIGSSWDDVAALPDGAFVSGAARELRQQLALLVHEEYGTSSLFVVKDPRISRLLPLWFAVLAELQIAPAIAIAVRNPLEVAASLKARDGFTTTKSLLLWLRHTIESELDSRGRPRSMVMYDELLRNWQEVLARVGDDLGVSWPGRSHRATVEIENFLSEHHRHHVFDWRDVEGRADVVSWVKEAYFALRASDPVRVLDQVRDELTQADIAFGPILEEARLELQASREQTLADATARDALGKDLEARDLALEARAAEVQQLHEKVGELKSAIADSASQAATHQAEVAALHAERDHLAHEVNRLGDEARHQTAAVEVAQGRVDAADAEIASTREELNTAYAEVDRLRKAADEAVSRAAALEANSSAERESLLTDLQAARATIAQLEERAAGANAALGALEAQTASDRGELLQELAEARADAERLTARIVAAESRSAAERTQLLADLDVRNAEASGLAIQLEDKSLEVEELALTADELLSSADAELEASRAKHDQLQSELTEKLEEQGQLLILVEHLEAALESATAALSEREQAAADLAGEFAARRAEFDAERSRLLEELEAVRTELEMGRSEVEVVQNELKMLRAEGANDRAALIAERDAARTEEARVVADLETMRTDAERLAARTSELEAALDAHQALVHAFRSVSRRRTPRRRTLSHLGTWLLPPTPRKLNYLRQYLLLRRSGEFDVDSYLLSNPDVLAAGINPLMHYVQYGRGEDRAVDGSIEPLRWTGEFDGDSYLRANPDVLAAGIDPLMHYVQYGHGEGRAVDGYVGPPNAADAIEVSSSGAIDSAGSRTLDAASSVDELIGTAFPLLRPLRVFPTPAKQGRRLTLVTDSLNEGSLFGGVGTSIVLVSLLAQRLDASLRIVTRLVPPNPANFGVVQRAQEVKFDRNVEFVFAPVVGHESLPLNDRDLFLTTSWWSTWSTVRAVSPERVVYLIQEDERMFYPAGDEQVACSETIADSRIRFVVNTAMLRDHLVQEGFSNLDRRGIPFEPAFPKRLYFPEARTADDPRRTFFFYARPNNVRNLFMHGLAAIDEAVSADILDPAEWSFHFVGSGIPSVQLKRGVTPIVSENLPWPAYAALIRGVDLGLSLMSTPHPSYPPLDLAACGAVAITNRYGMKQDLNSYSSNIICSDLAHDAIVEAIAAGVRLARDSKTRHRNYETQRLSRSWDSSLSAVLDELSDWA